jgi:hypothetical protein
MVVAVAGRRIDAPGASVVRFPRSAEQAVRARIGAALRECSARVVVAAAACGADLLALEAAADLGLHRRVVLPQGVRRFRAGSVIDRPGDWGQRFDAICRAAKEAGDLVVKRSTGDPQRDYERGNGLILDEAMRLARAEAGAGGSGADVIAVVVWDGIARDADDLTAAFKREAERRGLRVVEVLTKGGAGTRR